MAQVNRPKFTSTIINTGWTAAKRAENGQTLRMTALPHNVLPQNVATPPARSTALVTRPASSKTAIVPRDWAPTPTVTAEGVELPANLDDRFILLREPTSVRARSYRLLQHRLANQGNTQVVAVTSAKPGEGKTTCAINLALAFAEASSARVLLIEANLSRPALSGLFGTAPSSFMDRLVQRLDATPPYSVAAVFGSRLQVAALRTTPPQSFRLDRGLLQSALKGLRRCYDHIIIDAASVLESADVDVVSTCADGVVITARAGKSNKSAVEDAVNQLRPATVCGVVLLDT
jgi:Mrp family chromosome partitioning ATPase